MAPHADVTVEFPDLNLNWSGHGYCDSNEGDEPLENPFMVGIGLKHTLKMIPYWCSTT